MPSGKVHDRITIITAAAMVPAWWYGSPHPVRWEPCAMLVGATLFSGLWLSPDLDLDSSIYRRWGPFRFLWWPYQKIMPHRSPLTHSLFVGPLVRICYFLVVLWGLVRCATWAIATWTPLDRNALSRNMGDTLIGFFRARPDMLEMLLLGLLVGTALHVGADVLVSAAKRKAR